MELPLDQSTSGLYFINRLPALLYGVSYFSIVFGVAAVESLSILYIDLKKGVFTS